MSDLEKRIEELEKRVRDLEARPVYVPVYPQPFNPWYPPPPWQSPWVTTSNPIGPQTIG